MYHGQLDFDDRETVFRCPVLLLHGCQPIDINACFSLNCISYVELCQRKQINLLLLLQLGGIPEAITSTMLQRSIKYQGPIV